MDIRRDDFNNTKVVERIGAYAGLGIYILLMSVLLLLAFPIIIPGFQEQRWVIFWAQFALVICYFFVIIRFQGKGSATIKTKPAIAATLMIIAYCLLRYGMGGWHNGGTVVWAIQSLGIMEEDVPAKRYGELLVFGVLSSYLFHLLTKSLYIASVRRIKEKAKKEELRKVREEYDGLKGNLTLTEAEREARIEKNVDKRKYIEGISVDRGFLQMARKALSGAIVLAAALAAIGSFLMEYRKLRGP